MGQIVTLACPPNSAGSGLGCLASGESHQLLSTIVARVALRYAKSAMHPNVRHAELQPEPWVSIEVVAVHVGVRKDSIYRWIEQRVIGA